MQVIVGLGNPDEKYLNTRHNAGFLALAYIIREIGAELIDTKFEAKVHEMRDPKKNLLVFPQTYMNNSGSAVKAILDFYKLTPKDILILHDEVDLPLGTIKFTENSGTAGHNGVQSIVEALGTQEFRRIRIGIESRENKDQPPTEAFVLQTFTPEEMEKIPFEAIKARVLMELKPKV